MFRVWFAEHFGDRLKASKPTDQQPAEQAASADRKEDEPQSSQDSEVTEPKSKLPELKSLRFRLNLDPTVPYLADRGVTPKIIERYGLGLCSRGVLKGYVAIPVYDFSHAENTNPLAYLGRWPGDDYDEADGRPRYKWPEGFPKSRIIYGLRHALEGTTDEPLIVVEPRRGRHRRDGSLLLFVYDDLVATLARNAYVRAETSSTPLELSSRLEFDELFATRSGYAALDDRIAKTAAKKAELLTVLSVPAVPLHNNESELGARVSARRRDVSLHSRSERGARAMDIFTTLVETSKKLGVSAYAYFRDRISHRYDLDSLATSITLAAQTATSKPASV